MKKNSGPRPPKYPMWSQQGNFHYILKYAAERLFGGLDEATEPDVFVLAFKMSNNRFLPDIGFVPEDTVCRPSELAPLKRTTFNIRKLAFVDTAPPTASFEDLTRSFNHALFDFKDKVNSRLNSLAVAEGKVFFCSRFTLVEDYLVCVVLVLNRKAHAAFPSVPVELDGHFPYSYSSLLDAAVEVFLELCDSELHRKDPGRDMPWPNTKAMLERAAVKFASRSVFSGGITGDRSSLYDYCCKIASLRYEGSEVDGRILVAPKGEGVIPTVVFHEPVPLSSHRTARKLLELSSPTLWLFSALNHIYGFGRITGTKPEQASLCSIRFLRQHTWELLFGETVLMRVTLGEPSLPRTELPEDDLADMLRRWFSGISTTDVKTLIQLATTAAKQKHGTMVVVSAKPAAEAQRLRSQGMPINAMQLDEESLRAVTNIDGAVLVGVDGTCHAVGVILDGRATKKGSPGRGARYNSAVRYVRDREEATVAVVISEDGTIDILPQLMPQIRRTELDQALQRLRRFVAQGEKDDDEFQAVMRWFEDHRFYLQSSVCQEVNQLVESVVNELSGDLMGDGVEEFVPDEEMNDSYFFPANK